MTRLLVLGMLDIQPMSGYDIQQSLKMTDAERWGGVLIGSIYHAIKKLEQEGHVEITSIEQTGNRQKAIYKITDSGKKHLKDLVREALMVSSVFYPSTLYSGLSFFNKLSLEETKHALEQQLSTLNNEYAAVKQGYEAKVSVMQNSIPPMVKLIFDNMFAIIHQQQDFVEKALELLITQE